MLKNTLLCLDSQNKERRRQETHYYASEVGISAVPARFKANFGLFQPFQSPADMTRFWPNQPGLARIEAESARIREKKKKKLRRGTDARATTSDSGAAPSQPRPCFLDHITADPQREPFKGHTPSGHSSSPSKEEEEKMPNYRLSS